MPVKASACLLQPGQTNRNHDTRDNQLNQAKTHDVFGFQTGNGQYGQGPEWLQHIGPGVTPGNGHGRARDIGIQCQKHRTLS